MSLSTAEHARLEQDTNREVYWKRWGPYLADRQWGTVREDYSANGDAWNAFPHAQAAARAYRWGEDGLLSLTDAKGRLCFGLALWNGQDPILKERLFGLNGHEGNHGEDVKECYYHLESTPTHSWMQALYKYPQAAFPYEDLVAENRHRDRTQPEYELADTGIFDDDRYFDVFVRYAKAGANDILVEIEVVNRGPETASIHILPTWWYRNSWTWGCAHEGCEIKPRLSAKGLGRVDGHQDSLGAWKFAIEDAEAPLYFTDNETNHQRLFCKSNGSPFVKDGIHRRVIHGETDAVNPEQRGTKFASHHEIELVAGGSHIVRARFAAADEAPTDQSAWFGSVFDEIFAARRAESDAFFAALPGRPADPAKAAIVAKAYAGLLWTKQFYHYIVADWLKGDGNEPPPSPERAVEQRTSKHGAKFGTGEVGGVVAPTSANNAAVAGAWIPALVFGIPGDAVTAIVLGALMMYEIRPGPLIFEQNPTQISQIFNIALITQVLLLPCGYLGLKAFGAILKLPRSIVMTAVLIFSTVGAFSLRNSLFDVGLMAVFGVVGYFLEAKRMPLAPLVLGLILGPMVEENFRTGMIKAEGSFIPFLTRPICVGLIVVLMLAFVVPKLLSRLKPQPTPTP